MRGNSWELYQLIISRLDGERLSSSSYQNTLIELVRKGIGGFILFGGERHEVKNFLSHVQSIAETPLFIASDIERGAGQQLTGATGFPSQMAVAAAVDQHNTNDVRLLVEIIKAIAAESIDIGINMPLIPVLDVNKNPDNPIICTRAFSDNPGTVAWFGNVYIKTLEESGLVSCAKHFPGHGDTAIDSHISLPLISKPRQDLFDVDILPFREAIHTGISSIMIGHLSVPVFDTKPASLSGKVITDLLRKDLCFDGLILTDALSMHALREAKNVPAECMNAGIDILLHPEDPHGVVGELKQSVENGKVEKNSINRALERITRYKSGIRDIQTTVCDYSRHAELSETISDKAITLVKGESGSIPCANIHEYSLLLVGVENDYDVSPLKGLAHGKVFHINYLKDNRSVRQLHDHVIFALFTSIAAWKGSSGIREEALKRIKDIIHAARRSVVISFGSPYVLRHFGEADVLISAYDTTQQAQASVIRCLKGEKDFMGKLPVSLQT